MALSDFTAALACEGFGKTTIAEGYTMAFVYQILTTYFCLSLIFGVCAFYTPWAWKSKYAMAIMYGPLASSLVLIALWASVEIIWL